MYICAMEWFNFNGKLFKEDEPIIGSANRGLRYGDGIFETMKMIDGNIIFANEHFARLWKGMMTLQFDIPKHFTPEKLTAEITALATKNKHDKAARLRLTVIRGNGGLYDAVNHKPNYIIETWPLPQSSNTLNTNGLVLGLYSDAKKSCDVLSNIKHNNYLLYAMAALYAKKQQWNDAVVLNSNGNICETTIANIFMVKDDVVITPALTEGCVAGIMREQVIACLKTNNYTIKQTAVTYDMLLQADEVFITNAIYNLRWVQRIDDREYTNNIIHKINLAFCATI
jgi:branched-chain amino acid aminotransferase